MTVGQLKKLLANYDDSLLVLGSDNDGYYYDYNRVRVCPVDDGREVDPGKADPVLVLE